MSVRTRVDELEGEADFAAFTPDGSLDQMRSLQLARHGRQRLGWSGAVGHHGRARDDLDTRITLRDGADDLLVKTISEKSVIGIGAEVLEGQYGEPRLAYGDDPDRCRP